MRCLSLEEYAVYGIYDRHLYALPDRKLAGALSRHHSFRHRLGVLQNVVELSSLSELEPDRSVTTERSRTRQDQVAEAADYVARNGTNGASP